MGASCYQLPWALTLKNPEATNVNCFPIQSIKFIDWENQIQSWCKISESSFPLKSIAVFFFFGAFAQTIKVDDLAPNPWLSARELFDGSLCRLSFSPEPLHHNNCNATRFVNVLFFVVCFLDCLLILLFFIFTNNQRFQQKLDYLIRFGSVERNKAEKNHV